jgi:hypothetical protein
MVLRCPCLKEAGAGMCRGCSCWDGFAGGGGHWGAFLIVCCPSDMPCEPQEDQKDFLIRPVEQRDQRNARKQVAPVPSTFSRITIMPCPGSGKQRSSLQGGSLVDGGRASGPGRAAAAVWEEQAAVGCAGAGLAARRSVWQAGSGWPKCGEKPGSKTGAEQTTGCGTSPGRRGIGHLLPGQPLAVDVRLGRASVSIGHAVVGRGLLPECRCHLGALHCCPRRACRVQPPQPGHDTEPPIGLACTRPSTLCSGGRSSHVQAQCSAPSP